MDLGQYRYYDGRARSGEIQNGSAPQPVTAPAPAPAPASPSPDLLQSINWGSYLNGAGTGETLQITVKFANSDIGALTLDGIPVTPNDWTEYELQQVKSAFAVIETYLDVNFVTADMQAEPDLTIMIDDTALRYGMQGMFMPPDAGVTAGHGVFFRSGKGWDGDGSGGLEPGGTGFTTILHEMMHGLGLAHPHDEGGASVIMDGFSGSAFSDMASHDLNQGVFTVMSLVDGWQSGDFGASPDSTSGHVASLSPMDIGLLQTVYGPAQSGAGDDLYLLGAAQYSAIWDVSGIDEISAAHLSDNAVINLKAASLNYEPGGGGFVSHVGGIYGGLTSAKDSVIENATGGAGNDILTGNSADNQLAGGKGADQFIIEAGGGQDMIADFEPGIDQLSLPKDKIDTWDTARAAMRDEGGNLVIDLSGGDLSAEHNVQLSGLSSSDLTPADLGFSNAVSAKLFAPASAKLSNAFDGGDNLPKLQTISRISETVDAAAKPVAHRPAAKLVADSAAQNVTVVSVQPAAQSAALYNVQTANTGKTAQPVSSKSGHINHGQLTTTQSTPILNEAQLAAQSQHPPSDQAGFIFVAFLLIKLFPGF